jgi:homogentisate 1,2-dioxygenase
MGCNPVTVIVMHGRKYVYELRIYEIEPFGTGVLHLNFSTPCM